MSKTKRGKERKSNLLKRTPEQVQLGRPVTTMLPVENPVPGRFYSIDKTEDRWVDSWQEDRNILLYAKQRAIPLLEEITAGSIIYYIGVVGSFHKVGFGEVFGLVEPKAVKFYDLGDLSGL